MKYITILMALLLIGCSDKSTFEPEEDEPITTLTIVNQCVFEMDLVDWNDEYFGDDTVWDYILSGYHTGIAASSQSTREVEAGTAPIYFYTTTGSVPYKTGQVTVREGKSNVFIMSSGTDVYEAE